ncbi:MAG: hypothetical protein QOE36_3650 [Gaiellaceae bacterium]|nr:hypothetical protein [Gaiellaceae bacterium]
MGEAPEPARWLGHARPGRDLVGTASELGPLGSVGTVSCAD